MTLRPMVNPTVDRHGRTLPLGPRALSVWDPASHRWAEVRGEFGAAVGASVADIRLRLQFDN